MKKALKIIWIVVGILLALFLLLVLLVESGPKEEKGDTKGITVEEYKERVSQALKEIGDKTNLEILSEKKLDDGTKALALSENIYIFIDTGSDKYIDSVSLGMMSEALFTEKEDFDLALLLLVGTVDESLSMGERNLVIQELGLDNEVIFSEEYTKTYINNNVTYVYKGDLKDNFMLKAQLK